MKKESSLIGSEGGFSLLELIIAMAITIVITAMASTLLAGAMNIRSRGNEEVDALADAQRALNIMSREIGNAGFNLVDNGIVAADSTTDANGNSTIRIRSNLNKFTTSASTAARNGIGTAGEDAGEDIKYFVYPAANTTLLARYDAYSVAGGKSTVLANRLDSMHIHYFAQKVTYSTTGCDISGASSAEVAVASAKYIVLAVCVQLNAKGQPQSPGYQPASKILLVSDVALRNSNLNVY
jgi:Tfp pilus assembly protein PilW